MIGLVEGKRLRVKWFFFFPSKNGENGLLCALDQSFTRRWLDPVLPYFFISCGEGQTTLIKRVETRGDIHV